MTCYRIVVAYDGTRYHGWQMQPDATTISQVLTNTFKSVFSQKISIVGASRTDAGVHALGQVAVVRCPIDLPVDKVYRAWNNALPDDILIKDITKLNRLIHPHSGVIQKTYMYHFFLERPLPFVQRYGYYVDQQVDLDLLARAFKIFVGTYNFRSFCTGDDAESTVRTVDDIQLEFLKEYNAYRVTVKGKGFLRYMVRRLVGAALAVAAQKSFTIDDLQKVLIARNPCHTLPNAPAKGLVLYQISYDKKGDS